MTAPTSKYTYTAQVIASYTVQYEVTSDHALTAGEIRERAIEQFKHFDCGYYEEVDVGTIELYSVDNAVVIEP